MFRRFLRIALVLSTGLAALAALPALAQETVLVPTRVIYPGETIHADSLEEVALRRQLKNPAQIAFDWMQVEGKIARRTLLPGRLIAVTSVRDPYAVESGKLVKVVFANGALEISVNAVPLQNGAVGDMVRVRNVDSGLVLTGTVMADGTVRVAAS